MNRREGPGELSELSENGSATFEALFKRNYASLVGFFLNRGLKHADAEDSAQETLFRACRAYDQFKGRSTDATWLYAIAGNIWRNQHREKRALKRFGQDVSLDTSNELPLLEEILSGKKQPHYAIPMALEAVLLTERLMALRSAIQRLPPKMRRCLQLHCSGRFKHHEIAKLANVNVNTVKSTISQAKVKLKEELLRHHSEIFHNGDAQL